MAFPTSPTNGQQTTINGVIYTYSTALTAWTVATSTGANISANNFAWGMRIIVPLLFACTLGVVLRTRPTGARGLLLALILTAHVLAGVLYLVQLLTTASYL
jgi:hypothetical protein